MKVKNLRVTTDDYGAVGLRAQDYNTTAALREQFCR